MCGIAGIYNSTILPSSLLPIMKRMLARIQYRGPDESGIYIDKICPWECQAQHHRYFDRTATIVHSDKSLWIVYNGEIFNYIELKKDLIKAGHRFHTESDTEVLLHAYQEYGEMCLEQTEWSVCVCHLGQSKKELFLARDRVGIRPLFYTWHENTFIFGSEIKTLFEHPDSKAEFDLYCPFTGIHLLDYCIAYNCI